MMTERRNPYPGLRAFKREEAHLFFGRQHQVDCLLSHLMRRTQEDPPPASESASPLEEDAAAPIPGIDRFLAVLGTSGSGKSSLIKAGLIPALEAGLGGDSGVEWTCLEMRPRDEPVRRLALALQSAWKEEPAAENLIDPVEFIEMSLRRHRHAISELLDWNSFPPESNLLLLVDQFEEIFRFRDPEETATNNGEGDGSKSIRQRVDEADIFVSVLLEAVRHPRVHVVLTMRSEFLGDCAKFSGLTAAINASHHLTQRLSRKEMAEAIERPAQLFGGQVEPALVNRLINDVGGNSDQLPLLQHTLTRMWQIAYDKKPDNGAPPMASGAGPVLTLEHYMSGEIGTVGQCLFQHAKQIMSGLKEGDRAVARRLFCALTVRDATRRDTRRPTSLLQVAQAVSGEREPDEESIGRVTTVADAFRDTAASFLMPDASEEGELKPSTILDISHESIIRQWFTLKNEWIEQEAQSADAFRSFSRKAREAMRPAEPEAIARGRRRYEFADHLDNLSLKTAREWLDPALRAKTKGKSRPMPPNAGWALRYDPGDEESFNRTVRYIIESGVRREREVKERKWLLRLVAVSAVSIVGLTMMAWWAITRYQEANRKEKEATKRVVFAEDKEHEAANKLTEANAAALTASETSKKARKEADEAKEREAGAMLVIAQAYWRDGKLLSALPYLLAAEQGAPALKERQTFADELRPPVTFSHAVIHAHDPVTLSVSATGKWLAAGLGNGAVDIVSVADGAIQGTVAASPPVKLPAGVDRFTEESRFGPGGHTRFVFLPQGEVLMFFGGAPGLRMLNAGDRTMADPPWAAQLKEDTVHAVCFSPDGKRLLALAGSATASAQQGIRFGEGDAGLKLIVTDLPDGQKATRLSFKPTIPDSEVYIARSPLWKRAVHIAFAPDGRRVVLAAAGLLQMAELNAGETTWKWICPAVRSRGGSPNYGQRQDPPGSSPAFAIDPTTGEEGVRLFVPNERGELTSWVLSSIQAPVSGKKETTAYQWELKGESAQSPVLAADIIQTASAQVGVTSPQAAFGPLGQFIIWTGPDAFLRCWWDWQQSGPGGNQELPTIGVNTNRLAPSYPSHQFVESGPGAVRSVAVAPGGEWIATLSSERCTRFWSMDSTVTRMERHLHSLPGIDAIAAGADGQPVIHGADDDGDRLSIEGKVVYPGPPWNLYNLRMEELETSDKVLFSRNGSTLLRWARKHCDLFRIGSLDRPVLGFDRESEWAAISPTGDTLLVREPSGVLAAYAVATGKLIATLDPPAGMRFTAVEFSGSDECAAAFFGVLNANLLPYSNDWSASQVIRLNSGMTAGPVIRLEGDSKKADQSGAAGPWVAGCLSANGKRLFLVRRDGSLQIYDGDTGMAISASLPRIGKSNPHSPNSEEPVKEAIFRPEAVPLHIATNADGLMLAYLSADGVLGRWDVTEGKAIPTDPPVTGDSFSMLTLAGDGSVLAGNQVHLFKWRQGESSGEQVPLFAPANDWRRHSKDLSGLALDGYDTVPAKPEPAGPLDDFRNDVELSDLYAAVLESSRMLTRLKTADENPTARASALRKFATDNPLLKWIDDHAARAPAPAHPFISSAAAILIDQASQLGGEPADYMTEDAAEAAEARDNDKILTAFLLLARGGEAERIHLFRALARLHLFQYSGASEDLQAAGPLRTTVRSAVAKLLDRGNDELVHGKSAPHFRRASQWAGDDRWDLLYLEAFSKWLSAPAPELSMPDPATLRRNSREALPSAVKAWELLQQAPDTEIMPRQQQAALLAGRIAKQAGENDTAWKKWLEIAATCPSHSAEWKAMRVMALCLLGKFSEAETLLKPGDGPDGPELSEEDQLLQGTFFYLRSLDPSSPDKTKDKTAAVANFGKVRQKDREKFDSYFRSVPELYELQSDKQAAALFDGMPGQRPPRSKK